MTPAITRSTRAQAVARLRTETFDILIIGGGINGAGVARDLALRSKIAGAGLNIALVEQNHFASGTSSRNSHLIHGGLRYLKTLDFAVVRESLRERETLLRIAPHLVTPLPFLMPLAGFAQSIFYNAGLTIYDLLAGPGLKHHRRVSPEEVRRLEPGLAVPGMTSAAEYHDAQVKSGRLVLENIFEAIANGAACVNYVRAESNSRFRDTISGEGFEIRAKKVVDASGPWARDPQPRLVRGSHIIYPRLNASDHAIAYFEEKGRIIFFIPWGGRTLIGTTDVDHEGSPDDVVISEEEMAYLRRIAARVFPSSASMEPVASFSSLRPLLPSRGSATRASRDHRIFPDSSGVLHITGGKYTTYRAMAEEAVDLAMPALRHLHVTAEQPLNGNSRAAIRTLIDETPALARKYTLEKSQIVSMIHQYGVMVPAVLDCMPERDLAGVNKLDAARLIFGVRHEMAQSLEDVLSVSTTLAYEGRRSAITPDAWTLATSL